MSALFTPFRVGVLELSNRIVIAPMCQYSAVDGCMTDWHVIHLGHLALSGAALLTIEATAVLPEARITYDEPLDLPVGEIFTAALANCYIYCGWSRFAKPRVFHGNSPPACSYCYRFCRTCNRPGWMFKVGDMGA